MQAETIELVEDVGSGAGHKAGAHAIGLRAEPEIKAGGLHLISIEIGLALQLAACKQRLDRAIRQNARGSRHGHHSFLRRQNQKESIDASR
ncbi:hypothetical protein D3C86_1239070 [compost metagenome]